jgi:hypothetical protein
MQTYGPSCSDKKEQDVYRQLLALSPTLEERLNRGSEQEVFYIADMVCLPSGMWSLSFTDARVYLDNQRSIVRTL